MIVRWFGLPWDYIEYDLEWHKYDILLAVALDLDEREQHWRYLLAGGDSKKWRWGTSDKAGTVDTRRRALWNKIASKVKRGFKGDIGNIAQEDWDRVTRIEELWSDDSIHVRYEDERGTDITKKVEALQESGQELFMKSKVESEIASKLGPRGPS